MEKIIRKGTPTYVAQCHEMEILVAKVVHSQCPEIESLIKKYEKVFQDLPMKLPLKIIIET